MHELLKKRVALIITFTISCLVVFAMASRDFHYLRSTKASSEKLINNQEQGNDNNNPEQREYSAGQDNRIAKLTANAAILDEYLNKGNRRQNYGIYFASLDTYETEPTLLYTHNHEKNFAPASIYKVPLAMLTIRAADEGKLDLNKTAIHQGKSKALKTILELMIQESDNDAMSIFENQLGGYNDVQKKIKADFGVEIARIGQRSTAANIAQVLKHLYFNPNNYLTVESREYLINLMETARSWSRDRIPAAVNNYNQTHSSELRAATKIGTLNGIYQDAGLILAGKNDYVLVILNQNRRTSTEAINEISNITQTLLTDLE